MGRVLAIAVIVSYIALPITFYKALQIIPVVEIRALGMNVFLLLYLAGLFKLVYAIEKKNENAMQTEREEEE